MRQTKKVTARRKPAKRVVAVRRGTKGVWLIQHRHSFRLVPHRHTAYPLLALFMLLTGVFLVGWTRAVNADDVTVHASVKGIPPAEPAVILTPVAGTVFKHIPIAVNGRCPLDSYVELYRNNYFSGVALCEADGTFHLQSDLFVGSNELQARVFNKTDDEGPPSDLVTVSYQPPKPPGHTGSSTTTPPVTTASQLVLGSSFVYKGYFAGQDVSWKLNLTGGTPPYAVNVEWGDGTASLLSLTKVGGFNASHTYTHQNTYGNSYIMRIKATDGAGQEAYLQLISIINQEPAGASHGLPLVTINSSTMPPAFLQIARLLWPSYAVVALVLAAFWLGERRELEKLQLTPAIKKRHA